MAGRPKTRAKRLAQANGTAPPDPPCERINYQVAQLIGSGGPSEPREPRTPYTDEEVRARLLEVRDRALDYTVELCRAGIAEKLAVWQNTSERAMAEIARMDERKAGGSGGAVHLVVNGFDVHRIQFGSNVPGSIPTD